MGVAAVITTALMQHILGRIKKTWLTDVSPFFFLVVGAEEEKSRTVNIRNRDNQATQTKGDLIPVQEALKKLLKLKEERRRVNEI